MNAHRSNVAAHAHHSETRRRAPLNSVSTRIILCVFLSTLLTAVIVSWLSVGAIHNDVHRRVTERTQALLSERTREIEMWHAEATVALKASTHPNAPWANSLLTALDENPDRSISGLHWVRSGREGTARADSVPPNTILPAPPSVLEKYFDQFRLRTPMSPSQAGDSLSCLSSRIELAGPDPLGEPQTLGVLEGCLSEDTLYTYLQPTASDFKGARLLTVDEAGRIHAAGGVRSSSREGQTLPTKGSAFLPEGGLTSYETSAGISVVGGIMSITSTSWYLVSELDQKTAFAPAIQIMNQIFIVDVCIILLFSILAFKITIAIMQPIEALSEGAQRIAEGQMDYQIPVPKNNDDELGLLTRTFNQMMAKLRSNQLEIEQDRVRLGEKNEELQHANEILSQLSITDGLTKLHNHRYFQDHLTREIKRVSRTRAPLSLILIDIDDFKLLNDTHGHAAGDEVLMALAAIMNDSARESDLIARYGGEEFVILMPNTDLAGAVHLAEKIRMAVESTRLIIGDNMKPIDITISLGVALYDGNRREFFAVADRALYQAKDSGKNCVIIAGSETPPEA